MGSQIWTEVDDYFVGRLLPPDEVLRAAGERAEAAGLPPIQVSRVQGQFLALLARIQRARSILEVGTLGGYSTIWMARTLPPDGRMVTLEVEPRHAEVARENLQRAGLDGIVEVRLGRALDTLPALEKESAGPFDLVFIDADKPSNPDYFRWALRLSRPGTVIVVDNVVRGGAVIDEASRDAAVAGTRDLIDMIGSEPRVTATALQTVGEKGHDGFLLARVDH